MNRSGLLAAIAVAVVMLVTPAAAGVVNLNNSDVAIGGIDPVAYFSDGEPVSGVPEFQSTWNDATWQFVSAENKATFDADPEKYAPQYGGYCAWAVSQGYTAPIDPEAWSIVGGKLYLNYSTSVQQRWANDDNAIQRANDNWPEVKEGL